MEGIKVFLKRSNIEMYKREKNFGSIWFILRLDKTAMVLARMNITSNYVYATVSISKLFKRFEKVVFFGKPKRNIK